MNPVVSVHRLDTEREQQLDPLVLYLDDQGEGMPYVLDPVTGKTMRMQDLLDILDFQCLVFCIVR